MVDTQTVLLIDRLRALAEFSACLEDCDVWNPEIGKCSCGYTAARLAVNSSVCEAPDE